MVTLALLCLFKIDANKLLLFHYFMNASENFIFSCLKFIPVSLSSCSVSEMMWSSIIECSASVNKKIPESAKFWSILLLSCMNCGFSAPLGNVRHFSSVFPLNLGLTLFSSFCTHSFYGIDLYLSIKSNHYSKSFCILFLLVSIWTYILSISAFISFNLSKLFL